MPIQLSVPGLGQFPAIMNLSALNGANGFELDGVSADDYSGFFVSAAGDVNNDGIADILIGATHANSQAGKTYVVFGKASGWTSPISLGTLNDANGFELDGVSAYDYSGFSVSAAGDVNNDSIADIIIGAYSANSRAGKTYVVFGKASGWTSPISLDTLNGTNGFTLNGITTGDSSGCSVSTAGDLNNDGIADILIGALGANSNAGKIYVVFGNTNPWISPLSLDTLNGTNGFELDGVSALDLSGISVSTAGDVNNDGITDIIIGAPSINPSAGKTYVVFGKASGWTSPISLGTLNGANGFELDGVSANDVSGGSVSAGDVNNDGISDIIIGAYGANSRAGKTYVVFGKANGWISPISLNTLNGTNGFVLNGVSTGDWSGWSVSAAGDVNNDGIIDIIIGARYANSQAGKTYVVFGKASGWTSPILLDTLNGASGFVLDGVSVNDNSGISVSTAGDVNNDGIADIIIGAPHANSYAGKTYVVFGDSPPVLVNNSLTMTDCMVTLDSTHLAAYDLNHANSTLTFTASNVINGNFQRNVLGVVTPLAPPTFLQSDVTAGYIQFVSTNGSVPSYSMAVSGAGLGFVPATPAVVSFTAPACTAAPTSVSPSTQSPTPVSSVSPSTSSPSTNPTRAPSVSPASSVVSSAARTSPVWFLPVSQVVLLLDTTTAAYESVSGYLNGSNASSQPATHNDPYDSSSLEAMGAQLMLGAVALKLAQKSFSWAKSFWASEPLLKPGTKPALSEVTEGLQMLKDSDKSLHSAAKDLTAEMKHLSGKMESYNAYFEGTSEESENVFYPDFQKPGINFAYNAVAHKRTPSSAEQAAFTNSTRLEALGR